MTPPIAQSSTNQPSAAVNAAVSGFTTSAEPRPTTTRSARGAAAAQTKPAATPSNVVPRSTATKMRTAASAPPASAPLRLGAGPGAPGGPAAGPRGGGAGGGPRGERARAPGGVAAGGVFFFGPFPKKIWGRPPPPRAP